MPEFIFHETGLKGSFIIENFYAGDERGTFAKVFEKDIFADEGIDFCLNETFFSVSSRNVIRGLHFQTNQPQAKLVSVISGSVWDVIVDLRPESPSFLKWTAEILSAENHRSFYIPRGFAHGFASLENHTAVLYQCDGRYDKSMDTGIRFDDPDLAVDWPVDKKCAVVSKRDLNLMSLRKYMENPMNITEYDKRKTVHE